MIRLHFNAVGQRYVAVGRAQKNRGEVLGSAMNPFWSSLAMLFTQDLALPWYFRERHVLGAHHLPMEGPVLLAPTHRARWDALILPMATGRRITGRDCRFMVTRSEMKGLQGWFLYRLGCFPVDQGRPTLTTLRYAIDLLASGQQVVVFPEGKINRTDEPIRLRQGLVRLAQLSKTNGIPVSVVPVGIAYSEASPSASSSAAICFEAPLLAEGTGREAAAHMSQQLADRMHTAEQAARQAVGRPLKSH